MYLLALFILQNFKKILRANPELRGCAIFGTKMAHLSWTKFFWYNPLSSLSSTFWTFSLCKIQKNTYWGSRVIRMYYFWAQNGPFSPNKFFWKIFNIILINLLALSLCKILEKFFQQIQSYEDAQLLGPKWPISPNENFFQKTC